ncbi:methanogenic corrinoid protein MtbC1 [Desulfitispora alkaliphila]|uniref:cobalamin B12-binding domain-containing protein n=1 Tax=Desulfitispora alkaliphila TaxID=622674 RepID=UPI003D2590BB
MESYINNNNPLGKLASEYFDALLSENRELASKLILNAVEAGVDIRDIYMNVFQPCQYEIGRLWELNKVTIAQEHYFSAATQLIMAQLYSRIFSMERNGYCFVAASVADELHVIGLRMVVDFLEMDGWDTYYLGGNIPVEKILETVQKQRADRLGLSATMSYHVDKVAAVIEKVRSIEEFKSLKIVVGGLPFYINKNLWQQTGADGCAQDAKGAVELANGLVVPK